jgi:hypothetical protein
VFDSNFNRGCVCIGAVGFYCWFELKKVSGVDSAGEANDNTSNWWRLVGGGGGEVGQGRRFMQQHP